MSCTIPFSSRKRYSPDSTTTMRLVPTETSVGRTGFSGNVAERKYQPFSSPTPTWPSTDSRAAAVWPW